MKDEGLAALVSSAKSEDVATQKGLAEDLDQILRSVKGRLGADAAAVWLLEKDGPRVARQLGVGTDSFCPDSGTDARHIRQCLEICAPVAVDLVKEKQAGRRCPCSDFGIVSALYAPLTTRGRALGVLGVYLRMRKKFTPEEKELLSVFSGLAAIAIENDSLYHETNRQLADLQSLARASAALNSPQEKGALLRLIAEQGAALLDVPASCVVLLDAVGHPKVQAAFGLCRDERLSELVASSGVSAMVLAEKRVMAAWDLGQSPVLEHRELAAREGLVSAASAPLIYKGKAIGSLNVYARSARGFESRELHLLHTFANQAATAIENVSLFEDLVRAAAERRVDRLLYERSEWRLSALVAMHEITHELSNTLDLDKVLDITCDHVARIGHADIVAIRLFDPAGKMSRLVKQRGLSDQYVEATRRLEIGGAVAQLIATCRPVVIEDLGSHEHAGDFTTFVSHGYKSLALFPLTSRDRVIGSINVGHMHIYRFPAEDVEELLHLAHHAGPVIHNAYLYEQEKAAQESKDLLLSVVAHELRSPLTAISGYAQLIGRRLPQGDETPEKAVATILAQVQRLSNLADDLLDSSRLALGRFRVHKALVDLAALTRRVAESIQLSSSVHTIRIEGPDSVRVPLDETGISQVLENLIGNAIKYSPKGGDVTVTLSVRDREVKVAVRDQGIGIAPEHLGHIFERFYQVEATTGKKSGLGLGLNICKSIVDAHGGRIWVESKPGEGSTFFFTLPLVLDSGPQPGIM